MIHPQCSANAALPSDRQHANPSLYQPFWRPTARSDRALLLNGTSSRIQAKDGKTLRVHPHEAELVAARRRASDPEFIASYRRWRPMVERSIAWLVAGGNRRVPYRGLARNQQWLSLRVAAINLRRLVTMGLNHHSAGWMLA
jgi:hypothetical protein